MVRYVIRPNRIGTTPRRIAELVGAEKVLPVSSPTTFNYTKDLFFACPPDYRVEDAPAGYDLVRQFYVSNKKAQRQLLLAMELRAIPLFPTNAHVHDRWIVRPLRHSQGKDYRVVRGQPVIDFNTHYASPVILKTREFRAVFVKGELLAVYVKTFREGQTPSVELPWNHAQGSRFVTIECPTHHSLYPTIANLTDCALTRNAHVIAYDILQDSSGYWICEANFCPSLSIPRTLEALKQHLSR